MYSVCRVVFWLLLIFWVEVIVLKVLFVSLLFDYRLLRVLMNVCIWFVVLLKWVGELNMMVLVYLRLVGVVFGMFFIVLMLVF